MTIDNTVLFSAKLNHILNFFSDHRLFLVSKKYQQNSSQNGRHQEENASYEAWKGQRLR